MFEVTRREAKSLGLEKYWSGVPCRNGHDDLRYTSSGRCVICHSEDHKIRYSENKDSIRSKQLEYCQENREAARQRSRKFRADNPDYIKKYRHDNPGKISAISSKRRAAKIQRTPQWLDEDDWFLISEAYELSKLRSDLTGVKHEVDHIIPLQGELVSGLHVPWNLQVLTRNDNRSKSNNCFV